MENNIFLRYMDKWKHYTALGQYDSLLHDASPIFEYAIQNGDSAMISASGTYIAQAFLFENKFDSAAHYLDYAVMYDNHMNPECSSVMESCLGILALKKELNYSESIKHYIKAFELLDENDYGKKIIIYANISHIYFIKDDSLGYYYANHAYNWASNHPVSDYHKGIAALTLAQMNLLRHDTNAAAVCLETVDSAMSHSPHEGVITMATLTKADMYSLCNKPHQAEQEYIRAMGICTKDDISAYTRILLHYARFMSGIHRYKEAIPMLEKGLTISYLYGNAENRQFLLSELHNTYASMGNQDKAMEYNDFYHKFNDSIQAFRTEKEFNHMEIQNQRLRYEYELRLKEIDSLKMARQYNSYIAILIIAITAIGTALIIYRQKTLYYRNNFEKYRQSVKRMDIQLQNSDRKESSDADKELYLRIESLMKNGKCYREKDISLNKLADMLDSNRVYVSKAINHYSGTSFHSYINMYRIAEATSILSESGDKVILKNLAEDLGYNSLQVFYRAFQKETGCTPNQFRHELKRQENYNNKLI